MLNERIEVPVAVEKSQPTLDAARGNHRINRLAHRDPTCSQRTKVFCRLNGQVLPCQVHDDQRSQEFPGLVEVSVAAKALQHLCQDQVARRDRFRAERQVEFFGLWSYGSEEVVDPYTGIDQNYLSVLIASRSPCQLSLPRK